MSAVAAALRILFMTDTPPDRDSGAAGTEMQTIEALRRQGHAVDAIWADELGRRLQHGNLHYLLELPRAYRSCMLARLEGARYDVVHASQPHGYLAARAAHQLAAPPVFVHRSHGLEPRVDERLAQWRLPAARAWWRRIASGAMTQLLRRNVVGIARHADGHIVSSGLCADYLRERLHVPEPRIAVIAQAAPQAFIQTTIPPAQRSPNRLLYVGQFAFFKGPHVLAEAFASVADANPNATLTWVCAAAHHAQALALVPERARPRVTLLDWMPQPELMAVYDAHGMFLFPSLAEGFGKAMLEAMSRGLAVVASDEGGAHDLIASGDNGIRVPPGDAAALARACLALQGDEGAAHRLATRARETAVAHTWDRVGTETANFYRSLLDMRA